MNINDFKYAWRFIDEKFAKFSNEELSQIRITDIGNARAKWDKIVNFVVFERSSYIKSFVERTAPVFIGDCGWGSNESERTTKRFICEYLGKNNITNIALLYDRDTALETNSTLFCEKWSDFCYPDDSIVILFGSEFMIYYEDILYGIYRRRFF